MGGSFNPLHMGHINSLLTVKKKFQLDKLMLVPAYHPPFSEPLTEVTPKARWEMLKLGCKRHRFICINDEELKRKGLSYSYKTLESIQKQNENGQLFFIMGMDQFLIFDKWKFFKKILKISNLIVTSRPSLSLPKVLKDLPTGIKELVVKNEDSQLILKKPYKPIHFCQLKDMQVSSSLIKKRLENQKDIKHLVPPEVHQYISKNQLYKKNLDIKKFINFCKKEFKNKKAFRIENFDLTKKNLPFRASLLVSSSNTRHSKALAKHIEAQIFKKFQLRPLGKEGEEEARWIVLDYDDVVLHILYDHTRDIYKLEELWEDKKTKASEFLNQDTHSSI